MSQRYGFPLDAEHLPEHWETPEGKADGKTDIQPPFNKARLLGLCTGAPTTTA
jgi:hypothetical protein